MIGRPNQAQFYWQSSAAGFLLGILIGALSGVAAAIYWSVGISEEYVAGVLALPLLGVLIGAICGGAAGVAGSVYTTRRGRLPHFLMTTFVSLVAAAVIGAVFIGTALAAAIAVPASVALGLALPRVAERLRRPRPALLNEDE